KSGCASCRGPCREPERTSNWIMAQWGKNYDYSAVAPLLRHGLTTGGPEGERRWLRGALSQPLPLHFRPSRNVEHAHANEHCLRVASAPGQSLATPAAR